MKPFAKPSLAALVSLAVAACGGGAMSTTVLTTQGSEAAQAIAAAEAVGAEEYPKPSLYVKLAKDQVQQAKSLVRDDEDEYEKAVLLFERATADAQLALLLTRQINARQNARRARQQLESLSR